MKNVSLFVLLFFFGANISAQKLEYATQTNLPYYTEAINKSDSYIKEKCVLDVYYPKNSSGFATVIWFHGGGLTGGNKELPEELKNQGIAVISVNYRLGPKVISPKYIEDAAAAVAWVFKNIPSFGGDESLIFVSGHSAGGYLASMVGLDKKWLNTQGIDANKIAGLIPFSGQAITHFLVRKERGIPDT